MDQRVRPYLRRGGEAALIVIILMLSGVLLFGRWTCPIRSVVKLPCPGCGMLTAINSLIRGDLNDAFYSHPLVFVITAYTAFASVLYITGKLTGRALKTHGILLASIFILVWLWRLYGIFAIR